MAALRSRLSALGLAPDDRAAHEMYPAGYHEARYAAGYHDARHGHPPQPQASTYGNVPYDQMSGRPGQQGTWRGRDEEQDFWGRDRHPHDPPHHDHGAHPGAHGLWERVKGAFTGKGPKNYVRADERIREDVCEHLFHHPYVDASDIEVAVADGEVTLSGTVEARLVKRAAEECCDHVRGVKDVHNHLRVRRAAPGEAAR